MLALLIVQFRLYSAPTNYRVIDWGTKLIFYTTMNFITNDARDSVVTIMSRCYELQMEVSVHNQLVFTEFTIFNHLFSHPLHLCGITCTPSKINNTTD